MNKLFNGEKCANVTRKAILPEWFCFRQCQDGRFGAVQTERHFQAAGKGSGITGQSVSKGGNVLPVKQWLLHC
ncbi:hypothetical protein [Neisseria sp.]|uniref:hypothetical protein n=1 Tax=Neisseria sp. TaxID=192066 RepID=UPI0026DC7376|nr:hypothetical protein [Neisseria sp.]MDO4907949.1 hypothetical protein [Neisseria sp.]